MDQTLRILLAVEALGALDGGAAGGNAVAVGGDVGPAPHPAVPRAVLVGQADGRGESRAALALADAVTVTAWEGSIGSKVVWKEQQSGNQRRCRAASIWMSYTSS